MKKMMMVVVKMIEKVEEEEGEGSLCHSSSHRPCLLLAERQPVY